MQVSPRPMAIEALRRDLASWRILLGESKGAPVEREVSGVGASALRVPEGMPAAAAAGVRRSTFSLSEDSVDMSPSPSRRRSSGREAKAPTRYKKMEYLEGEKRQLADGEAKGHSDVARARKFFRSAPLLPRSKRETYYLKFYDPRTQLHSTEGYRGDLGAQGWDINDMAHLECFSAWMYRLAVGSVIPKAALVPLKKEGGGISHYTFALAEIPAFESVEAARIRLHQDGLVTLLREPYNRPVLARLLTGAVYLGNVDASASNMGFTRGQLTAMDFDLTFFTVLYPGQLAIPSPDDIFYGYRPPVTYVRISSPVRRWEKKEPVVPIMLAIQHVLAYSSTSDDRYLIANFRWYQTGFEEYQRYLTHEDRAFTPEERARYQLPPIRGIEDLVSVAHTIRSWGFFPMRLVPDGDRRNPTWFDQLRRRRFEGGEYTLQDEAYEAWLRWLLFPPALQEALIENILAACPRAHAHVMNYLRDRPFELFQALNTSEGFKVFFRRHGVTALERIRAHYLSQWEDNKYIRHLFHDDAAFFHATIQSQVSFVFVTTRIEAELQRREEEERMRSERALACLQEQKRREAAEVARRETEASLQREQEKAIKTAWETPRVDEWNRAIREWILACLIQEIIRRPEENLKRKLFEALRDIILASIHWQDFMSRPDSSENRLNRWVSVLRLITFISVYQEYGGSRLFGPSRGSIELEKRMRGTLVGRNPWELFVRQIIAEAQTYPTAKWFSPFYQVWGTQTARALSETLEKTVLMSSDTVHWQSSAATVSHFATTHLTFRPAVAPPVGMAATAAGAGGGVSVAAASATPRTVAPAGMRI